MIGINCIRNVLQPVLCAHLCRRIVQVAERCNCSPVNSTSYSSLICRAWRAICLLHEWLLFLLAVSDWYTQHPIVCSTWRAAKEALSSIVSVVSKTKYAHSNVLFLLVNVHLGTRLVIHLQLTCEYQLKIVSSER